MDLVNLGVIRAWGVRPEETHLHNFCSSQNDLLLITALPRAPAVHGCDRSVHTGGTEDSQTQHGELWELGQFGEVLL